MQKEQLLELRSKIVQSAQAVALHGDAAPEERLQVLLNFVRSGDANLEILTKVYELSQTMSNGDDKLSVLLDVLYEVDAKLNQEDTPRTGASQETSQPQQPASANQPY